MCITEETNKGIQLYKISGLLNASTAATLKENIADEIALGKTDMIFDFQDLRYLSSAGLRVIIQIHQELKRLKGKVVLCCVVDYIREVFEISGLDSSIPIAIGREDARRLFS